MPTLTEILQSIIGVGNAQAAEPWQANRGTTSRVEPVSYAGQQMPAVNAGSNPGYQGAWLKAQSMGPPPTWGNLPPQQLAQRMAEWQQLQQIIKQGR